jgi:hypothetical protein
MLGEEQIHLAVVDHLRSRADPRAVWWHTPNQSKASPQYRRKLAAMGLRPGVSDLVFLHNGEAFALELKRQKGGVVSDNQDQFLADWKAAGGEGFIARGLDEALACMKAWGVLR